jgi:hypothetical protein
VLSLLPAISGSEEMADIVRVSVSPVFLLSGIAAFVLVLTNRLARVTDRLRDKDETVVTPAGRKILHQRSRVILSGIRLLTVCATLVCSVVVTLFFDYFTDLPLEPLIAVLFISAMVLLALALYCLLREVNLVSQGLPEDS